MNVSVNIFALDSTPFHKERIAYMKSRGPGCFDAAYYAAQSHDLQSSVGAAACCALTILPMQLNSDSLNA